MGNPAAVSWGPERIDIVARTSSDGLVHKSFNGRWSAWTDLGGPIASSLGITSAGPAHLDVYAVTAEGWLWHKEFDFGWRDWTVIGGWNAVEFARHRPRRRPTGETSS